MEAGSGTRTGDAWKFVERIEFVMLEWSLPEGISSEKSIVKPVFEQAWPGEFLCFRLLF